MPAMVSYFTTKIVRQKNIHSQTANTTGVYLMSESQLFMINKIRHHFFTCLYIDLDFSYLLRISFLSSV